VLGRVTGAGAIGSLCRHTRKACYWIDRLLVPSFKPIVKHVGVVFDSILEHAHGIKYEQRTQQLALCSAEYQKHPLDRYSLCLQSIQRHMTEFMVSAGGGNPLYRYRLCLNDMTKM
jgi:hypothetical protein